MYTYTYTHAHTHVTLKNAFVAQENNFEAHHSTAQFRQSLIVLYRMVWYLQSMQGFYSSKTPAKTLTGEICSKKLSCKLQTMSYISCQYKTNSSHHRSCLIN